MKTVGIDLGTTNTVAAVDRRVFQLDPVSGPLLPSVVAFPPTGFRMVGTEARRRRPIDPKNTVYSTKRLIGRKWFSADVKEFMKRYDFELVEEEGSPGFKTRAGVFTPVDIAMLILERVGHFSQHDLGDISAIITVPSMFKEDGREATREAGMLAGLAEVQIIDEPTAVALAYMSASKGRINTAAVYDFGGGTFDLAVVDCSRDRLKVLGFGGDLYLGGDDIDKHLAEWASDQVLKAYNWDLRSEREVYARLLTECEQAKIRLSGSQQTRIDLTRVDPSSPFAAMELPIHQELLAELSGDLVRRTFVICDEVLRDVGMKPQDLDALFVAGGATQLPLLRNQVESYFGKPIEYAFHPMHTVAIGASIAAGQL
jgi:molecular chaperone DnaK